MPTASNHWSHAAAALFTTAAAVIISAVTLTAEITLTLSSGLLVFAVFYIAMGAVCLLAQWDTNRGRKVKTFELRTDGPP